MNHSFRFDKLDITKCEICKRGVMDHLSTAKCESCSAIGDCELIGDILMCSTCQEREKAIVSEPKVERSETTIESLNNNIQKVSIDENLIKGNIESYQTFFNGNIPSIIELEKRVMADSNITEKHFHIARVLEQRIKFLTKALFDIKELQIETSAEVKAIQKYMNELIPQMRKEQRAQFAEHDINYKPEVKTIRAPIVRKTPEEKMAESYAKYMKISIEEARRKVAPQLRAEFGCTCTETPGLCKVHKS